jgi:hypothetical protein
VAAERVQGVGVGGLGFVQDIEGKAHSRNRFSLVPAPGSLIAPLIVGEPK